MSKITKLNLTMGFNHVIILDEISFHTKYSNRIHVIVSQHLLSDYESQGPETMEFQFGRSLFVPQNQKDLKIMALTTHRLSGGL